MLNAIKSGSNVEGLVIAIFPQLCKLLAVDSSKLRAQVGEMMESVNIGKALADASTRVEAAESKVDMLERENEDLLIAIDELREENERLHRDVAIFSASSALT
jgi:chaperonin cofactor prefoldin